MGVGQTEQGTSKSRLNRDSLHERSNFLFDIFLPCSEYWSVGFWLFLFLLLFDAGRWLDLSSVYYRVLGFTKIG